MSDFIPPYPKRHTKEINPFQALYYAQQDLLSIWDEESFEVEFMHRKILKQNIFIANSPDLVRYIFVEAKENYERKSPQMRRALEPLLGDGLFISDGDTWASRRKIQMPLFDSAHIKMFSRVMTSTIHEMAEEWAKVPEGGEVNVHTEMGKLTAEIIARTLFGEKLGSENSAAVVDAFAAYQSVVKQMALSNFLGLPDWWPNVNAKVGKARKAAKTIHNAVDAIIAKAEEGGHDGTLVAELLKANQTESGIDTMTKEQIRNELIVLFMAGHETTANVLAWTWYLISQAPEVEKKLHAELDEVLQGRTPEFADVDKLKYTRAILDETMRLYPPVPILSREALEGDTIRGKKVPPGSIMLIVPWLIQRHKKYWDKPDHFIPERFMPDAPKPIKFTYIPFSAGPRVCLAKNFGIIESVLSIAILAQKFRLSLDENQKVEHECRLTLRPKGRLPMKIQNRN
ncbi:cytochrome P450 [Cocleimonas flava]|uniref:Cytochrome P450 n=1 Tax=Cocleimonas flava TaxID=634765 RepID=A0A4V2P879_9GAMM|nr:MULTISPECIES: cytochrome P450 [Cocleimonas]MEB8433968.1 cytochrome P450 [Cocleimonas sp. KMM 6892]MEC4716779.1 cytochrome P450 [Cocleimonas sp. KMM 6895]MEC4746066.1 cytochrome P450 [Cocleimonas sp. KMM 6896]TCJ84705.1 cytochrome P450 [Cocleimonas flava]